MEIFKAEAGLEILEIYKMLTWICVLAHFNAN